MLKTIITIASLIVLPSFAGATTVEPPILKDFEQQNKPAQHQPAQPQAADPVYLQPAKHVSPVDILISKENAPLGRKSRKAVTLAEEWINKPVLPSVEEKDGWVVYTFGATLPIVVCRPLRVCVLRLEPGEKIIDPPQAGDKVNWKITPSEAKSERAPHIYIKPLDSGLTTNLVIMTDKRTYVVCLKSRNDKYTPLVSFRYPENEDRQWVAHIEKQTRLEKENQQNNRFRSGNITFNAEDLDFNYSVEGEARWKPRRVFNDGVKTYIKMPEIMKMYEAPVLLTINDGKEALVNYRLNDDLFTVDQIFDSAILISGVGSDQYKVTITRDSARTHNQGGAYHEDTN